MMNESKKAYALSCGATVATSGDNPSIVIYNGGSSIWIGKDDLKVLLEAYRYSLGVTPYAWAYRDSVCEQFTTEQSEYRNQPGIEEVIPLYAY